MKLKIIEIQCKYILCKNGHDELAMLVIVNESLDQFNDILITRDVKSLFLCTAFNHPVNNLPNNIEKLFIKRLYKNYFKYGDYTLSYVLSSDLSKQVKKILNLPTMIGVSVFNQPLDNLPINLKVLQIYWEYFNFKQSLDYLPAGLKMLGIGLEYPNGMLDNLPNGLKILKIKFNDLSQITLINLPKTLINLKIDTFNTSWSCNFNDLPQSIKHLDLGTHFNGSLEHLPKKLHTLTLFTWHFDYIRYLEPFTIPNSLKLFIGFASNKICRYIKEKYKIKIYLDDEEVYL